MNLNCKIFFYYSPVRYPELEKTLQCRKKDKWAFLMMRDSSTCFLRKIILVCNTFYYSIIFPIYFHIDPNQYEIINEELSFAEAKAKCKDKNFKLFEPKDTSTNNEVQKFAEDNGLNKFWIGIHNHVYASDNTPLLWSNFKPKPLDQSCDDNYCPCAGPGCDEVNGLIPPSTFNFGKWAGKCCSIKKFGAVCDKKIGKFSEIIVFALVILLKRTIFLVC